VRNRESRIVPCSLKSLTAVLLNCPLRAGFSCLFTLELLTPVYYYPPPP
jgi:hypothetical protein